ncbi:RHS repeat-associated core domain-containing protein, partial [Burkholderia ubonensis]|uniref:RHS repeat-associated core domain-containing protein n=1 Tax=Burkholderia ubonensis TaxID=101571 RepID=UPI000B1CAB28
VWEASYKAWGEAREVIARASKAAGIMPRNLLRFQGQQVDEETGLHYNRYRYYDPGSGRFISKDPIGLAGGSNAYQYVPNSVQWVDPLGLTGKKAVDIAHEALANGQKSGAASVITTASGKQFPAVSGEVVMPQNDEMTGVLMGAPRESRAAWHGGCSEIAAMEKALNAGESLAGATMDTVAIGSSTPAHGKPKPACCTCKFAMKHYGVRER